MTSSPLTIPTWLAVLGLAALLAVWTLVFASLMGDHVAAATGTHAAAAVTAHMRLVG